MPSNPFDFDACDDDQEPFDFRARRDAGRKLHADNTPLLGTIAIGLQLLATLSFGVWPWPVATLALAVAQLVGVVFVASASRGRGAETAVWCLAALCFPLAGTIAFVVAQPTS